MSADATEALSAIRSLVEQAKGVPMTSNVLVPRAEVLELLDRAESAVAAQGAVPAAEAEAILEQARAEAEGIVAEARGRAEGLVSETEVSRAAEEEALAFKHEADTWVDGRLSELETGLHRTLEQIETMRERLHQRSRIDDEE
ncbi:hypothetical protein J4N02_10095 [Propioniciclava sp. MC1595]|uniref:hypothetical protein n=1 Tax=Propioniciclava sp. MC1595 TaxID=2760308 RepID=UPI0016628663|nr:hypothetical protein [Propioniciclava sp. MC1595]MBB1493896.1 hypothetical protein [Propioniciclava sp. MC1595]QTE24917.1 hypothetical protein J4N02_10095 [Propioniciclava sp. MC1595]